MRSMIDKIVPQDGNPKAAGGVVVNGTLLPADFVVMGVGVAPATEFLKGSGIEVEKDGGVKVNEYLQVQSGPDTQNVYAIGSYWSLFPTHFVKPPNVTIFPGDIAVYPERDGTHTRIEHWNVCSNFLVRIFAFTKISLLRLLATMVGPSGKRLPEAHNHL